MRLIDIDGNVLEDEKIDQIQNRFRMHIAKLLDDDLEIEKEKLLYHIEREEQRISTSVDKINIYATIILTVIPIVVALIDFGSIKDLPIVLQVMICIAVYSLLNICIYIFRTIKVHGIKKSSFSDLRESSDRKKEIVMQYQYDWQQLKYKAQLFVSFVLNLQEWVVVLLILTVGISFGVSVQDDSIASVDIKNTKSIVFTMNAEEIGKPYSNSAVNWQNDLALMISGEAVTAKIQEYAAVSMNLTTKNEIFSAMIVYGFLSYENGEVRIPNKELMNKFDDMIHKVSKLKAQKYNKKKWRYVQKQLKKSKKILYSNAATQKSINSAKSDLKKSINKLRRK